MQKTGLLLVNLGSPNAPTKSAVKVYLKEFLSDPRVLDFNPVFRWFLLTFLVLPRRSPVAANAYQSIWMDEGSPLVVHAHQLAKLLSQQLGESFVVEVGMRYQEPSLSSAMARLQAKGVERVIVLPLFPQYSTAAWGSAVAKVYELASEYWDTPSLQVVPPFFDKPPYIRAVGAVAAPGLKAFRPDYYLMSFHGLPIRHLKKAQNCGQYCYSEQSCCSKLSSKNYQCYRAQCYETARRIAEELKISPDQYEVCFQSRFGKDPWIEPFIDPVLLSLPKKGVKRLAVFSPAFAADCLETLEELAMDYSAQFCEAGGEAFHLVPALNSHPAWVNAIEELVLPLKA